MPHGNPGSPRFPRSLWLVALLSLPAIAAAPSPGYILTDLGLLAGSSECSATGLNNRGQVVGTCVGTALPGRFSRTEAFLYGDGAMTGLGTLPGNDSSSARAINDSGWIIGSSFNAPSTATGQIATIQGFLYRDDILSGLPGNGSIPTAINAWGQIVGYTAAVGQTPRGFVYADGTATPLDLFPTAIDIGGRIVGDGLGAAGARWVSGGTTIPLDIPAGAFAQAPSALNDQGEMVGTTTLSYGPPIGNSPYGGFGQDSAYRYTQGTVTYLGFLPGYNQTTPRAINNRGLIVGDASYQGAPPPECRGGVTGDLVAYMAKCRPLLSKPNRAFLYAERRMADLNTLLSPAQAAQYRLTAASAINDAGQIAATASVNGLSRAVLLTPAGLQAKAQSAAQPLVTFQASLLADAGDGALRASFEPGPVAGRNGQVFVVALLPTAQGGGVYFIDGDGAWHAFSRCEAAPAYSAPGPLAELAAITLLNEANMARLGQSGITLYLGYGLAGIADPTGSACRDMLKFGNYLPLATL